jgi:hypothetical protein
VRDVVVALFLCGAVAIVAGYLPQGAIAVGTTTNTSYECAGGDVLALNLALLLLPGVAVFHRPSWTRIAIWIAWASLYFTVRFATPTDPSPLWRAHSLHATPLWPAWVAYALVLAIMCGLIVVLPIVRLSDAAATGPRPARLPSARVLRGS